jgi:hypothetical protein
MIGILGSGFGLYGYLPALCLYYPYEKILLSSRAKYNFDSRLELKLYSNQIIWIDDIIDIINKSELLIISYPPFEVEKLSDYLISAKVLKKIIIEKPLCENPEKSQKLINKIELSGKKIVSSFIFIYTDWFQNISENQSINHQVHWELTNINPVNSWKWNPELGGGLLRFYGIHLIAVCAIFDFEIINIINNSFEKFEGIFGKNSKKIHITITYTDKNPLFLVDDFYKGPTPFGIQHNQDEQDFRIKYLLNLIDDFDKNYNKLNTLLKKTISLWDQIENQS